MVKLEVFDPAMCCDTGICGASDDPKLVVFASDLEWLKKQNVEVVRHGLSFEPAEFVSNKDVKNLICERGNVSLPILVIDNKIVSSGVYPSRKKLAELCNIKYNEDEAPPVHREENCCCGEDCDCSHVSINEKLGCDVKKNIADESICCCGQTCDCSNSAAEDNCCCIISEESSNINPKSVRSKFEVSDMFKKVLFIVVLFIVAMMIAFKLANKVAAFDIKKDSQLASPEKITENIDSLNQIPVSQEVVFIYIPKVNGKIDNKAKRAMYVAQNVLKTKGIKAFLYTINPKSLDYPQLASKTAPPSVLTIYKSKGRSYVAGAINTSTLMQSYTAAKQDEACGPNCPCHKK